MQIKQGIDSGGGMHDKIFLEIRKYIEQNIDIPESIVSNWFEPSYILSILKEEREKLVYDISDPKNDPWHPLHKNLAKDYRNWCFLDGLNKYSSCDEDSSEYIFNKFADWGFREDHIGTLIYWMSERLKEMNAQVKIKQIINNIKNFNKGLYPETVDNPVSILLTWFE